MKAKMKIKTGIDFLMTALLLLLMAYRITGQKFHECFGVGMSALFILHNIQMFGNLFIGKCMLLRIIYSIGFYGVYRSDELPGIYRLLFGEKDKKAV